MASCNQIEQIFSNQNLIQPSGLLAYGGDLAPQTLLLAYENGVFPWYGKGEPILWWNPDPRCVLRPGNFNISKRSARKIRNGNFSFTIDRAFAQVIQNCAAPRKSGAGTWILPEMQSAYLKMHELGYAHSIEIWEENELVGGIYGIALGKIFFGESMFRKCGEASRSALLALMALLAQNGFLLLDCQQQTPHMMAMGAEIIPRSEFIDILKKAANQEALPVAKWQDLAFSLGDKLPFPPKI